MNFNDPREFDDLQVSDDPNEISIESMNFDDPKVYGDTLIFDGLVLISGRFRPGTLADFSVKGVP